MVKRVSFSKQHQDLDEISAYYHNVKQSVDFYFSDNNPNKADIFGSTSTFKVANLHETTLKEHERLTALNILAALEAAFRIDYVQRCHNKKKDKLSRAFQKIYKDKGARASLEDDIFVAWKQNTNLPNNIISELKAAFKYRHWLAHGRYWQLKLGRKYSYDYIFTLAQIIFDNFPFEKI